MSEHDVESAVFHGERLLEIELDGKKENVLIKEVQYDTFGQEVIHVDLARVRLDERVEVTVPILLRGTPAGVSEGGVLQQAANEVTLECLVSEIPEEIALQVTDLNVGDAQYMRDLPLAEGAKLLSDSDAMVCSVIVIAEEEAPPEVEEGEEAAAEPEIIGEKPEEGEEQEAEK
jgi:large subunit ribosomal protein L25